MDTTEAVVKAGILVIIQQVKRGQLTPAQAREKLDARLTELDSDADRLLYNRLVAQVAMLEPAITSAQESL
jgi:hypothetical protein